MWMVQWGKGQNMGVRAQSRPNPSATAVHRASVKTADCLCVCVPVCACTCVGGCRCVLPVVFGLWGPCAVQGPGGISPLRGFGAWGVWALPPSPPPMGTPPARAQCWAQVACPHGRTLRDPFSNSAPVGGGGVGGGSQTSPPPPPPKVIGPIFSPGLQPIKNFLCHLCKEIDKNRAIWGVGKGGWPTMDMPMG